ncbi:MAG: PadR family transcriptional regulator [Armatimonadota bacterium]|nr:PadR family transcriptional regulator [Armatimonadota bacterium]
MAQKSQMLKGNVALLILAAVAREPAHGYAISQSIADASEGYFDMKEGTLYAHLHELERDGLLTSSWDVASGRPRRYYKVTDKGLKKLAAERKEWDAFAGSMNRALNALTPRTGEV